MKIIITYILLLITICVIVSGNPGDKGKAIVDSVINKIHGSQIFRADNDLLKRIAFVESKFGEDSGTYRAGYYGGIWQVDKVGFQDTQNVASHPSLKGLHSSIKDKFGIDWSKITWQDLLEPLNSGLASRLFLSLIPEAIPLSIELQANYWKKYYNRNGAGTPQKFIDDVKKMETSY